MFRGSHTSGGPPSATPVLVAAGFEKPSAIQQKGIVPFGKGLDVIQQAQSGTGKTATFCAGVLQSLDFSLVECQALILAPTRELAQQIEKVMRALGDYLQVSALPERRRRLSACSGGWLGTGAVSLSTQFWKPGASMFRDTCSSTALVLWQECYT